MRPMMCDVHFKEDAVFVLGWTGDDKSPMRSLREPVVRLDHAPDASALGLAVRQALDLSGTPMPEPFGSYHTTRRRLDEILRDAGIQSWSRLNSSARGLSVEDDGSRVKIHARRHRNSDPKIDDATCGRDPEQIGRSLLELSRSCPVSDPLDSVRPGRSYRQPRPGPAVDGGTPPSFGYKFRWIVVDTTDAVAVASALGLKHPRPATWDIDPYGHDGVFVSPSVLGWTFVLGLYTEPHLPDFRPLLEDLSRRFGEVQYFTTHRVVELHAWALAIDGRIVRGYGWIGERGEVVMGIGELTPEEQELGFSRFIDSRTIDGDWEDVDLPDEEDVMRIAGKWSINPQELDAYDSEGPGFIGRLP